MRVLIIGGTGFIGSYVTRRLAEQSHEVAVFHRRQTISDLPPSVSHIYGDCRNLEDFRGNFKKFSPKVVLDMLLYFEDDATKLVRAFRGLTERIVAISSMDVYRAYGCFLRLQKARPSLKSFDENAPLRNSLFPYRKFSRTSNDLLYNYEKILVERIIMNDAYLPGTVLRLAKVYGPGDKQHHLYNYLKRMDDNRAAILLDDEKAQWRWTRIYVGNVADAIVLAVTNDQAAGRIYNVGEKQGFTEAEWVEKIGKAAGWNGKIKAVPHKSLPEHLVEPYDWRHHLVADTTRIRQELFYKERVDTAEALSHTVAWERANPPKETGGTE